MPTASTHNAGRWGGTESTLGAQGSTQALPLVRAADLELQACTQAPHRGAASVKCGHRDGGTAGRRQRRALEVAAAEAAAALALRVVYAQRAGSVGAAQVPVCNREEGRDGG